MYWVSGNGNAISLEASRAGAGAVAAPSDISCLPIREVMPKTLPPSITESEETETEAFLVVKKKKETDGTDQFGKQDSGS